MMTRRTLNSQILFSLLGLPFAVRVLSPLAVAQDHSNVEDAFDVVSIKPINPAGGNSVGVDFAGPDVLKIGFISLLGLISVAWNESPWQIASTEDWIKDTKFNIQAVLPAAPAGAPYSTEHSWFTLADPRLRRMLQTMLADRFKLKTHSEERPSPVFSLQRDPNRSLKLVESDESKAGLNRDFAAGTLGAVVDQGFSVHDMSMKGLAKWLSDTALHLPVVDDTGITGAYNFTSQTVFTQADFDNHMQDQALVSAVKEMGLQLQRKSGTATLLVVDSASLPSPD